MSIKLRLSISLLAIASMSTLFGGPLQAQVDHPLAQYVNESDSNYSYTAVAQVPGPGFTAHILNMNSLRWRDAAEVTPNIWNHWVTVIVPDQLHSAKAHLIVDDGPLRATPPEMGDIEDFVPIALATGMITVILEQVPGQPLQFADLPGPVSEDELVAYSWRKLMETGDPTWAAYLPMAKAAVRGMDTVSDYVSTALGATISDYILTGFSKRGAAAWLAAAVDPRVSAVAAGVFSILKITEQIEKHYRSYGFYSSALDDFVHNDILSQLRSPEGELLTSIVDPYSYVSSLTMPHYILTAAGDQFFLPDSTELFIGDIPGNALQRIVPNADHRFGAQKEAALLGLVSWLQTEVLGVPRPKISWNLSESDILEVTTDQPAAQVLLWKATNTVARDFRMETIGDKAWTPSMLIADDDGVYRAPLSAPASGYTAYMVELTYPGISDIPQIYTTSVFINPNTYQFENSDPILDPKAPRYWARQVKKALNGEPQDYTLEQLQALLPIRVFGEYVNTVAELKTNLKRFQGGNRSCTAARLNVEAQKIGWYSNIEIPFIGDGKFWELYKLAEVAHDEGLGLRPAYICYKLTRQ